jgi:asparagine synthase (glutamine-hydrolysing)
MCGIFGIADFRPSAGIDAKRFSAALSLLSHRGPDGAGIEQVAEHVMLGHRRLAIIDLSDGSAQPMQRAGRYWLTYNGEIFNYLELRNELIAQGEQFSTAGDTEVVLAAYHRWGSECVNRFNGMWAFAIYDTVEGTLFCSRDRFGIKPFNYVSDDEQFLFSSEIKALLAYRSDLAEPDYTAIASFCRASVGAQHEQTWFRKVKRLQPAHNLLVSSSGDITISRYWDYPDDKVELPEGDAWRRYRDLFEDAVRLRMRSDVPLGITLSAGIDSNSIAYAMQAANRAPHHSFTARFVADNFVTGRALYRNPNMAIDEAVVARREAEKLGLTPHVVDTRYGELPRELARIVWHLESGNSSPAVIPLMQLMAEARKSLTVVLEGQGADELLAGYVGNVLLARLAGLLRRGRVGGAWKGLREYARTYTIKGAILLWLRLASNRWPLIAAARQRLAGLDRLYGPKLARCKTLPDFPPLRPVSRESAMARSLREQHSGGLVNLLHYGDAVSMAQSVESRLPFLDHRLVEFVWRLPDEFKLAEGIGKVIHRRAMRGLVDDGILDERVKFGFSTPISNEFRGDTEQARQCIAILTSDRCSARGLFDPGEMSRLIKDHRSGKSDHGPLLFRLLSTELWFRQFIDRDWTELSSERPTQREIRAA